MSHPEGTVTDWLRSLKDGDCDAVQRLWQGYFPRLVALARTKLRGTPRRFADEEDVALSAFDSFCRAAEAGRFPRLDDRDDLWQVLVTVTLRKAIDLVAYQSRGRRDWRLETPRDLLPGGDSSGEGSVLLDVLHGSEPDPRFAAELAERFDALLAALPDDELRRIAVMRMEGHTNAEIASAIGRAEPTVERRLRLIRTLWADSAPPGPARSETPEDE